MPANLTPEYHSAEKRHKAAKTIEERIFTLEEMISALPKHKGTDKLFGELKKKLSRLKDDQETQAKKGSGRKEHWQVRKEGAAQVVLVGPPNSGKSAILNTMTRATPQISDYPFATRMPVPGMMPFEDIQFQLIELPAVTVDVMETWLPNAIMMADAMILVFDFSADGLLDDAEAVFKKIMERHVFMAAEGVEDQFLRVKRTMILANKMDDEMATDNLELFQEWLATYTLPREEEADGPSHDEGIRGLKVFPYSSLEDHRISALPRVVYDFLQLIRVYPKRPGKKLVKEDPLVLPAGSTVLEAARSLHKEIAEKLKYARAWGEGIYEGQQLARDFVLKDGFVLEFHF